MIQWTGIPEFAAALQRTVERTSAEARVFVAEAAASVEALAKDHASGRPGPEVVTGTLRRGITHDPITPWGVGGWQTRVGPTVIYSRRIELGFAGTDSLGRRYNQPPYPYFGPATAAVARDMPRLWALHMRAALGL